MNMALEEMVCSRYGEDAWKRVLAHARIECAAFVSNEAYPDEVTYQLVAAAAVVAGISQEHVLEAFGEHWILYTARHGYGYLLDASGQTLREFLANLENFHTRVRLVFPYLQPPEFTCLDLDANTLRLIYHSRRVGLAPMVRGLLLGLGRKFQTPLDIRHERSGGQDEFLIQFPAP
jgi:hypothetical protein